MGSDLPSFLSLFSMGVIIRQRDKSILSLQQFSNDKNQYQISVDGNGEYSFTNEAFDFSKPNHRVFYEGTEKVLEYFYDGQALSLQVFTTRQANFFVDIEAKFCRVEAVGALCIEGKHNIETSLSIKAQALILGGFIHSQERIELHSAEGLHLFGVIETKQMHIVANYYHSTANTVVHEHYDIAAQVVRKSENSYSKAKSIRLIAQVCGIEGEFEVHSSIFLVAQHLMLGTLDRKISIQLPAQHHIHVGACIIEGETSIVTGMIGTICSDAQWLIDEDMTIGASSSFTGYHTKIQSRKIENQGEFLADNCNMAIKILVQKHDFQLIHSVIVGKSLYIESGRLLSLDSHVIGETIHVFGGDLIIQDESILDLSDKLASEKDAGVKINASQISVSKKISLQGITHIEQSHIYSGIFYSYQRINIKQSELVVERMKLQAKVFIFKTNFLATYATFSGQLYLDDLLINSQSVEYKSSNASINRNYVRSEQIILHGGTSQESFVLKNSRLVAKNFTVFHTAFSQRTTFVGMDDADMCHSICGQLILNKSQFITNSRIHSLIGTYIHPCEFSKITSSVMDVAGDLDVDDSYVRCSALNLTNSVATVQNGRISANQTIRAQHANIMLDANSELSAESLAISRHSQLRLNKSNMLLSKQVVSDSGSKIQSDNSSIVSKKIIFQGSAELTHSLLSAEELLLYERFVTDHGMVQVEQNISFADTAEAKLSDSALSAKNIDSFGDLELRDSQVQASENASLWTDSKTTLSGASVINASDVVIRGQVVTQKKKSEPPKHKPIIIAQKHLDISPQSKLSGDEDLTLSADIINQSGNIDLNSDFYAKGRRFDNLGKTSAALLDLRFDDAVVNQGTFSTKNLTIHSNLMNIFGRIYAEQLMSSSGFVSLNMGLIAANNYMNDSLASMNLGIIAPNVLADPRFIFSWNNLISTARTLAMMCAPVHTSGIQIAFMLPGFLMSSVGLYQKTKGFTRIFDLKHHEYMPILCQIKSLALLGQGLYINGNSLYNQEYFNWQTSFGKMYSNPNDFGQDCWQTFQDTNWQEFGINSAEAFAGSYTDTSLIHANLGVSLGANTFKTNLLHVNLGEERSLFTHNIATNRLYNRGQSTGSKSSFTATTIQNQGTLLGTQQFSLRSKMVDNTSQGHIRGTHASVDIEKLNQNGEFVAEEGRIHIGTFQDRNDASTTMRQVVLEGDTLDSSGHLDLSHSAVHEKEHFITSTSSQFVSDDVSIETGVFHGKGQLDYQHHLSIQASTAILDEGSIVNGQRTDKDKLFVPGKDGAQSEFKPEHVLVIEAEKVDLGGRLGGGDYTQIQGCRASTDSTESTKSEELIVRNTADIDLTHGSIKSKQAVISGKTSLDGFDIDIDTAMIEQEKGGLLLDNARYKGHSLQTNGTFQFDHSALIMDELEQHGEMHGMHSSMKVDTILDDAHASTLLEEVILEGKRLDLIGGAQLSRVHIQEDEYVHAAEGSKLKTDDVEIETQDFREEGALDYSHHLTIKAKKAAFAKGSVVNGQTTADEQLFAQHSENADFTLTRSPISVEIDH